MKMPPSILPNWHPRSELSRPTAEQIERVENRKQTLTYAGPNAVLPLVYGEQIVSGPVIAGPVIDANDRLVYAIGLCWAGDEGIERIEDVRLGDSVQAFDAITDPNAGTSLTVVTGVAVRVYDGRQTAPNTTLASAIPGFDDAFHGLAYAIVYVSSSVEISGLPQLTFRIKGRKCRAFSSSPWSPLSLPFEPNDIVQTPITGLILVVGDSGQLLTGSSLGALVSRNPGFGTSNIYKAGVSGGTWNNERFFVVGQHGKISKTSTYNPASNNWELSTGVLGSVDLYAASVSLHSTGMVGGEGGGAATSATSTTSWTARDVGFGSSAILCIAAVTGGVFVAGADGKVASAGSMTGTWTPRDSKFGSASIRCMVTSLDYSGISDSNRLILLGDDGKVSWSADGETFTLVDAGFGGANITHAVRTARGVFALSDDGQIRETQDGEHWHATLLPHGNFRKLFYAADLLIAVDTDGNSFTIDPADISRNRWTENPVLHMYDFVTNSEFGMGANLIGVEAAAAVADSFYSGMPRSRTGLTIQDPMTEEDALSLFAQYAEVLWSYDGRDVAIIPDAPVDTIHDIDAGTIREGSLRLSTVGLEQIPTMVRVLFSDRSEPDWASRPAVAQVPEHTMHGMPTSPSDVPLPGVYNRIEAERRAYQRLMRLQTPGRIEWQMIAPGMPYQAGDVVRLPDVRGLQSIEVRLTAQPEMIAPLLYQMAGEIYSDAHYPAGGGGTAVPEGAIMILRGSGAVPDGWQAFNMGGRLVREGAPGNAGSLTSITMSRTSSSEPAHRLNYQTTTSGPGGVRVLGIIPNPSGPHYVTGGSGSDGWGGAHAHTFSVTLSALDIVPTRHVRFVKKVNGPGLVPAGVSMLSPGNIADARFVEALSLQGGYLVGSSAESKTSAQQLSSITSTADGDHGHGIIRGIADTEGTSSPSYGRVGVVLGPHTHRVSASYTAQYRSIALAVLESLGDATLPSGSIVGWEGETAPEGWAFCDGDNGTIDLRNRFIFITRSDQAGTAHRESSAVTITMGGTSSSDGGHNHDLQLTSRSNSYGTGFYHTNNKEPHSHTISDPTQTFSLDNVRRYQLRFIQYIGD